MSFRSFTCTPRCRQARQPGPVRQGPIKRSKSTWSYSWFIRVQYQIIISAGAYPFPQSKHQLHTYKLFGPPLPAHFQRRQACWSPHLPERRDTSPSVSTRGRGNTLKDRTSMCKRMCSFDEATNNYVCPATRPPGTQTHLPSPAKCPSGEILSTRRQPPRPRGNKLNCKCARNVCCIMQGRAAPSGMKALG